MAITGLALWEYIILVVVSGATFMFVTSGLIGYIFLKKKEADERSVRIFMDALNRLPETMVKVYTDMQKAEDESKKKKEFENYMKNREDTNPFNRV